MKLSPNVIHINNPDILGISQTTIDIQFILDAYACVIYVTSNIKKSERAMGDLLKQVSKECESESTQHQLRCLGSTFLNHRKISAQESVNWLLSMYLKHKVGKLYS